MVTGAVQVVAAALEDLVRQFVDLHIEVARGAALRARVAIAGGAEPRTLLDARGDLQANARLVLGAAHAAAGAALLGAATGFRSAAAAGLARHEPLELQFALHALGRVFERDL